MKRVQHIIAERDGVKVKVRIETVAQPDTLVRSETEGLVSNISSGVMQVLANARYLHVPLSELRVK